MVTNGYVQCRGCTNTIKIEHRTSLPRWCSDCKKEHARIKAVDYRASKKKQPTAEKEMIERVKLYLSLGCCPCCAKPW